MFLILYSLEMKEVDGLNGKAIILIIIIGTLAALILAWFWMENIIEDYDVDRKAITDEINYLIS